MSTKLVVSAVRALLCVGAAHGAWAAAVPLANYRAVHDLSLDPETDSGDIGAMNGRVVTEFKGSECAGYTTTTRFVTEAVDSNDDHHLVDSRSVTVEKPDGSLDFDNRTLENGTESDATKGIANHGADGIRIRLEKPSHKTVDLTGDIAFPTEQVTRAIAAAKAGERFLAFPTYDGLDDGETTAPATVVIGAGSTDPSDVGDEAPIADAGFATMMHWPMTITYFDSKGGIDQAPQYSLSALVYENGVMRRLKLNYGRFVLVGKLVQLDVLPSTPCR